MYGESSCRQAGADLLRRAEASPKTPTMMASWPYGRSDREGRRAATDGSFVRSLLDDRGAAHALGFRARDGEASPRPRAAPLPGTPGRATAFTNSSSMEWPTTRDVRRGGDHVPALRGSLHRSLLL